MLLFSLSSQGQSPTAINGRTFQMTISNGTLPFASSGSFRFLPAGSDSRYAIVPISSNIAASSGTHTYTKLAANTARLSLVDNDLGSLTANFTFTTATSGTYSVTSPAAPGSSQTGTFFMYAGTSPATLVGTAITVSITSGAFPFADFGTYRFRPNLTGNGYTVEALTGNISGSTGTYSYTKNSTWTGLISFSDSVAGPGMNSHVSFDSATTGTVLLWQAGGTGYQTGLFFVTTLPTISTHPSNLTRNVGASASFTIAATGSAPLSYQWRKGGQNILNATGTTYTIPSVQSGDAANYDVVVSNSAGSATSNPATLTVIVPPSISAHPTGLTALQGTTVNFDVTATGTAPLSYQWMRNGNNINGATLSTYSIASVQGPHAGSHTVRVSNASGLPATSNPAALVVDLIATTPPAFGAQSWNSTSGFSATLQVEPQTRYRIQWSSNLTTWFDLNTIVPTSTSFQVSDPAAKTQPKLFYRAVSP